MTRRRVSKAILVESAPCCDRTCHRCALESVLIHYGGVSVSKDKFLDGVSRRTFFSATAGVFGAASVARPSRHVDASFPRAMSSLRRASFIVASSAGGWAATCWSAITVPSRCFVGAGARRGAFPPCAARGTTRWFGRPRPITRGRMAGFGIRPILSECCSREELRGRGVAMIPYRTPDTRSSTNGQR